MTETTVSMTETTVSKAETTVSVAMSVLVERQKVVPERYLPRFSPTMAFPTPVINHHQWPDVRQSRLLGESAGQPRRSD